MKLTCLGFITYSLPANSLRYHVNLKKGLEVLVLKDCGLKWIGNSLKKLAPIQET